MDITVTTGRVINSYEFYLDKTMQLYVRVNGTDFDFAEWSAGAGLPFLKCIWPMFRRLFCVKIESIVRDHHLDIETNMLQIYFHFFKRHFRWHDTMPDIVETTNGMVINFELDAQQECAFCLYQMAGCKPSSDPDLFCTQFVFHGAPLKLGVGA